MKKRVVVFGIFDGVHDGHRNFFAQTKKYGDELAVTVGRDSASLMWKGKKPKHTEGDRLKLVLKELNVDLAVLGDEEQSTYSVLRELNPDVICLGYDQEELAEDLQAWMKGKGKQISLYVLKPHKADSFHTSFL